MEETTLKLAVKKFLQKGYNSNLEDEQLAIACNQLINKASSGSIKSGLTLARKFYKICKGKDGILEITATKTLARLTHMSGKHSEALPIYLKAKRLAKSDQIDRARINRALVDVYMYLGDFKKSQTAAQKAISTFRKLKAESDLIMTEINYANLLHRQDRHKKAEILYRKGADYFTKNGNNLAAARCNYNRANTLVQLFDLEEAKILYEEAKQAYTNAGFTLDANDALYGLAWLNMLTGRFHTAIKNLSVCKKIYHDGGDPRGEGLCILDLAEVYLGLGLYSDAIEAAKASKKIFSRLKLRYESAKASLFLGQSALALGHKKMATRACDEAANGFRADKNIGFTGVTYLLAADLADQNHKFKKQKLRLARSCFKRTQLPLWEAIADLHRAADPKHAEAALQKISKNRAAHNVPHLYAMWQISKGDRNAERGNFESARRCWQKAADRLDMVRAQLPPVELRNSYGHSLRSPHLRLISSELQNNSRRASAWLERYKTAGIWSPLPVAEKFQDKRKAAEKSLCLLASQVAALAGQIYSKTAQRNFPTKTSQKKISKLQSQIRGYIVDIEESTESSVGSVNRLVDDIRNISFQMPIVQFHQQENDIIAFVHCDGRMSTFRLSGGILRLKKALRRWRFILEGELLTEQTGGIWDYEPEQALWADLGDWLWSPLGIDRNNSKVLIIPEGDTANLPWQALSVKGENLGNYHHFIISPSIRHFMAAQNRNFDSTKIEVFRGNADNLPNIDKELEIFEKRIEKNINLHHPCNRDMWPSSGDAMVWHFAGHAVLRADNPFYSHLLLEDGPLFAVDFRLKQCQVGVVSLAACRSGEQVSMPGEESIGLIRSLLEMGARNVIASRWPVSDKSTAMWMSKFYDSFFKNYSILESARIAAESVKKEFPSAYHWAGFAVFGAGNMGGSGEK